ncbi:fumarylacetoacetate hydrolase family protein [Hazenella sp. IB182357]|uniref:Fumarylacetoacetate hydrolase family protein n=1 Tax=Polycladospora coralii TaxID=2771432 RepID=A0A926N857_9BACL|nr:fumarylacetoacetate hydrolase family protein [Polycladospora coralii]
MDASKRFKHTLKREGTVKLNLASIRNVYCVGRNYALHAAELGNQKPSNPMFFSKPTHSLVKADGRTLSLPGDRGLIHYETEFVIHLARPYVEGLPIEQIVDSFAIGIDFTLRDEQEQLKSKGYPWLVAKGFRNAAVLSTFFPFDSIDACRDKEFSLHKNGVQVQVGCIRDMIFDLRTLLRSCSQQLGLDAGDIIYTGTPSGVGEIADGDQLHLFWDQKNIGDVRITLS